MTATLLKHVAVKKQMFFIRDLLQMINKFAALLLIGMASLYQILDWYGGRHTCHTASGALAVRHESLHIHFKEQLLKQTLKVGVNVQGFYAKLLKRSFHDFESEDEVADSLLKCSCCLL